MAQTVPVAGDVDANVAEHVQLARVAAGMGARVLVFPELSLTGYEMGRANDLAFAVDDVRLAPLVETAWSRQVTLVVGAPVRISGNLHIAAFIIGEDERVQVYTKHHLGTFPESASVDGTVPPGEPTVFVEGSLNPMLDIGGHRTALAVCADANRPKHAAAAAARGADTYLVGSFVIPSEFAEATENLRAWSSCHRMAVAFANYGGSTGLMRTAGQTSFWSEEGELMGRLDREGRGVLVALEDGGGWNVDSACF